MEQSGVDRELAAIRAQLEELAESPVLLQFAQVWEEIGLEEKHRAGRREIMRVHLQDLLEEMVCEEVELKRKLIESVASCSEELAQLCRQLSLPQEPPQTELSLLDREKLLRNRVDALNKEKHNRMKRLKRLTEMESAMCGVVGEESQLAQKWKDNLLPSEEDLGRFRKWIEELEAKKDERQVVFFQRREEMLRMWEELEIKPCGNLEEAIFKGDIKGFTLSVANMARLEELREKLLDSAIELEARSVTLRDSIRSLWERLEVPEEEREAFSNQHPGYKMRTIEALEAEVARLNDLKRKHMQKFVLATRAELHKVWEQCFFGDRQKREFSPAFSDDFSEDLLSAHESELDRMKGFYADNIDVFKLVEKRENLWKKHEEFERKDKDPSRFTNRGGALLKDEKVRKQVARELPKVEKEIQAVLTAWENDHERYFLVLDERYLETIQRQWQEKSEIKEKEKMKRQKTKETTTMLEMTYGSKPTTPIKRRAVTTPSSAPIKVRRVGPSPLVKATRTAKLTHTVSSTQNKKPVLPSGKTPKRAHRPQASRKILGEKNTFLADNMAADESFISHRNTSMASTCASYTDFQSGLVQGLDSATTARSSSIPKSSSLNHMV